MTFLLRHERSLLLLATLLVLLGSGWQPHDRATWWLEVAPVLIALPILLATHHRHPLTPLLYRLLFLHGVILMVGGHYTYARVPLGFWFADWFDLTRNHYDRLGHLGRHGFERCWNGSIAQAFRRLVNTRKKPPYCEGCHYVHGVYEQTRTI